MDNNIEKSQKEDSKKKNKNNKYLWSLLFVVIAVLTVWAVTAQSKTFSISSFLSFVGTLDIKFVICAFLAMIGFIFFEALAIKTVASSFGYKRSIMRNYTYSAADIYFSSITPSASGGQPASALFMIQDGIPGPMVTVILLVNLVMYTFAILVLGIICFILSPAIFLHFSGFSKFLIIIGCITQLLIAFAFIMLLRHGKILYKICSFFLLILAKMRIIKNLNEKKQRLSESIERYRGYVHQIKDKKLMLLKTFIFNFLQRSSMIAVTVFTFLATGGAFSETIDIWAAQSMVVLGSNTVPIPGAMGVADYLLLDAFGDIMSESAAVNLELLSRAISFYVCVIICGVTFLIRCLLSRYMKRKVQNDRLL